MKATAPFLFIAAAIAGVSFVLQQAVNARLRTALDSPWWAGFASYAGGTIVMGSVIVALREGWGAPGDRGSTPWWAWTGGLFGAIYIAVSILLVPRLGTATVVALIVLGQMLSSLVFDHLGAFGVPRVPIGGSRIVGAALLLAGVILIRR